MTTEEQYLEAKEVVEKYEEEQRGIARSSDKQFFTHKDSNSWDRRCWRGDDYCDCELKKECMYNDIKGIF